MGILIKIELKGVTMKKILSISLIALLIFATSCSGSANDKPVVVKATDVMEDIKAREVNTGDKLTEENSIIIKDFGTKLLRNNFDKESGNTLISPVSVIYALGMTANGADGETLKEMENAFGFSIEDLNGYLNAYLKILPMGEGYKFNIANSIWFRDNLDFTPKEEFLQKNKDYYDAKIFKAKFDNGTVKEINAWVNDNTSGMIDSIIDRIPENAVMYLINALSLEADWKKQYSENQITKGDFNKENGEIEKVDFMHDSLYKYIEGENEKGFIKQYKDSKYSFIALLPNEKIKMEDYISQLTGEKIHKLLDNVEDVEVDTTIPKFENEFSYSLNDSLKNMGIKKIFSREESDLSKIGENLFVNDVIHKTFISVHEKGTEAGAVTAVVVESESAMDETKEVYLNRPFVYMIIDGEENVPIFLGTYGGR